MNYYAGWNVMLTLKPLNKGKKDKISTNYTPFQKIIVYDY